MFRDICMMLSGGMISVMGYGLVACTGASFQNMNKWLWNAVLSDYQNLCQARRLET
jgi:hypothetical protein